MNILSVNYIIQVILFVCIYWLFIKKASFQNLFLLWVSSYIYSTWDVRALALLLGITLFSYTTCNYIERKTIRTKKTILFLNLLVSFSILFIFKYYNFFISEFIKGFHLQPSTLPLLNIGLPIGISFYIFTTTATVIDVFKGVSKAEKNPITYFTFITFFPLIISGPIERSAHLLPQLRERREFSLSLFADGVTQIAWGVFKKMVIADNCATVVNLAFGNYEVLPASSLWIGAILYSLQIYFDFSGYSDIAIGFSKLFGLRVRNNFNYPYFAINISDFWRRWHMSLQRWFLDYIYFPLGGSRCSKGKTLLNTFIVFTICGIWHGANWTFLVWGLYNAFLFIPYILFFKKRTKRNISNDVLIPSFNELIQMGLTFLLVTFGWILFNSPSISVALDYMGSMFNQSIFSNPTGIGLSTFSSIGLLIVASTILEWTCKDREFAFQFRSPGWVKVILIYSIFAMLIFCKAGTSDFIYLQF